MTTDTGEVIGFGVGREKMSALDEPLLETAKSTWPTTHHFQPRCAIAHAGVLRLREALRLLCGRWWIHDHFPGAEDHHVRRRMWRWRVARSQCWPWRSSRCGYLNLSVLLQDMRHVWFSER